MKKYYQIENYGHGFITHEDMEIAHISGYPGDIWVTTNTQWAQRVGAIELTKEQAQDIVNAAITTTWTPPNTIEPPHITLP